MSTATAIVLLVLGAGILFLALRRSRVRRTLKPGRTPPGAPRPGGRPAPDTEEGASKRGRWARARMERSGSGRPPSLPGAARAHGAFTLGGDRPLPHALERILETMQLGVTVTDPQGRILYANPAGARMHGWSSEELVGRPGTILDAGPAAPLPPADELPASGTWRHEAIAARQDGTTFPVQRLSDVVRDPEGRTVAVVTTHEDITRRKGHEEQLVQEALYDGLTGLPNRAVLTDLLNRAIARLSRRRSYAFAVLFLDLDRFKQVNDALGHAAGDLLLVQVARRLEKSVRPGDVVTRMGGDEFCILVDDVGDSRDATRVARRVLELLGRPISVDGRPVVIGCSIGIALSEKGLEDPLDILRNADAAMYRAKRSGRSRFELFDRAMHERVLETMRAERELRKALDRDQFRLVYQPVVRLEDRRILGMEALVRWEHPERGLLPPDQFVAQAEETGLMVPIGWWVLDEACARMAQWTRRSPSMKEMFVSVNLSGRQLRHPDLGDRVRQSLSRTGLDPSQLRLEVSETILMDDPEWHSTVLSDLRETGVQVQVDDFGTGTSSLSFLERLSVSTLKIDGSYLEDMGGGGDRSAVIQAIVTLARHLNLHVLAEGVETDAHETRLRELKLDQGQGYLFHEPLDEEALLVILDRQVGTGEGAAT